MDFFTDQSKHTRIDISIKSDSSDIEEEKEHKQDDSRIIVEKYLFYIGFAIPVTWFIGSSYWGDHQSSLIWKKRCRIASTIVLTFVILAVVVLMVVIPSIFGLKSDYVSGGQTSSSSQSANRPGVPLSDSRNWGDIMAGVSINKDVSIEGIQLSGRMSHANRSLFRSKVLGSYHIIPLPLGIYLHCDLTENVLSSYRVNMRVIPSRRLIQANKGYFYNTGRCMLTTEHFTIVSKYEYKKQKDRESVADIMCIYTFKYIACEVDLFIACEVDQCMPCKTLLYHFAVLWIIEPSKRSDMLMEEPKATRSTDVSFTCTG
ncbi:hypothetical protein BDB01DRAFT_832561 [Pilobolus umbonatus]|nr:hypothetical protein BDB01DRAFT_832561 [Pilobolus umbonatus]